MASADQRPSSEQNPKTPALFGRPLLSSLIRPFIAPLGRLLRVDERIAAAREQGTLEERQRQEPLTALAVEQARLDGVLLAARSMAHQVNSSLSVIVGYNELLQQTPRDRREREFLAATAEASGEITGFVAAINRVQRVVTTTPPAMPDTQILDLARSIQPKTPDNKP